MLSRLIFSFPFFVASTLALAQRVDYKKVDLPLEYFPISINEQSIHLKANLYNDIYWVHAIQPKWKPSIGLLADDSLKFVHQVEADGRFGYAYFYRSENSQNSFIVASVHSFEDGLSSTYFFKVDGKQVKFLGEFFILEKRNNDPLIGGYFGVFPKGISIYKLDKMKIEFDSNEYLIMDNGVEAVFKGRIELQSKNGDFEVSKIEEL
ncbi:hypothetical protein SAMN05421640_1623 [Ekhidna lutea]|uniref:Uncharacterized protein n=1 Tax=Ekhidna lutea TaxID=447679 RepID=A0A239IE40_EKHLU|nr:hypothetical protein [Ekhidna lutea]SNS91817.1 hypothetical protein SAMN05421640_1623 [Ekhidna lutea]